MMNYIWGGMIVIAIIAAIATGRTAELSDAIIGSSQNAVTLFLKMMGMLCLWNGLTRIAEKSGLTKILAKLLSPILKPIFPGLDLKSKAAKAISLNLTANILGLGNAATPLGIQAMKELQKENPSPLAASNHMVSFVVMNSAALHIIPTTVAMMRQDFGSKNPMEIMPASWISSICALTAGLIMVKVLEAGVKRK